MATTVDEFARARRLASSMNASAPPVDEALPAVRALLDAINEPYRIVGGVAVVHHGYVRTTVDIDVLVGPSALAAIAGVATSMGFSVESRARLRHQASGVRVDLLIAGDAMPRGGHVYPDPATTEASNSDAAVVGLAALFDLKLCAHRHQDLADIVALLKLATDAAYLEVESRVPASRRAELAALRRDALEELSFEQA